MEKKTWLDYFNLSDHYERKARFLPGLISVLFLVPVSAAFGAPLSGWIDTLALGIGAAAAVAVGLSHLASAAGNRFQERLWPRWPYDSPTNQWLLPNDRSRSEQQKTLWYAAIHRLTGLDVFTSTSLPEDEIERVIDDAVSALRYRLRNSEHADRLRLHNTDYGFARNFTGLRLFWVIASVLSCAGCFASYFWASGSVDWCVISSILMIFSFPLAFVILPNYVRRKARHYAESFYGAVVELDRAEHRVSEGLQSKEARRSGGTIRPDGVQGGRNRIRNA